MDNKEITLLGNIYIAEKGNKRIEYKFKHSSGLILMKYNENTTLKDLKPLIKMAKKLKYRLIEVTELEHAIKNNLSENWKDIEVFDYVTNQIVCLKVRECKGSK